MTSIQESNPTQVPIYFGERRQRDHWGYADNYSIWSCRFSADGNEIVAGGSGKLFGEP